jgi:hypothetical protein
MLEPIGDYVDGFGNDVGLLIDGLSNFGVFGIDQLNNLAGRQTVETFRRGITGFSSEMF